MKNSCLIAALAASVLWMGLAGTPAAAQAPGTQFVAPTVALVDVNYIFKNHPRFKAQMEEMRVSVTNSQTEWKRQKEGLTKLVERLQEFRAGTPDYQQMEEQIVGEKTRLSTKMQLEQKAFLQREAKIYYDIYQEISQEVQYICQQKGITLVMNFNGDKINPENPDDVLRGINQKIVYNTKELDITPLVLRRFQQAANKDNGPVPPIGVKY